MSIIAARLTGCRFEQLNDAAFLEQVMRQAIEVGGFQLLHCYVHRFQPQGITACAVLGESHFALHSWPEEGILFVDIATCSRPDATRRAFHFLRSRVHHAEVRQESLLNAEASV